MGHGYYSEDLIEKIRYSNDLVDVAAEYTKLKEQGNSYIGLCPFHNEKTPSFNVNPDRQLYYCFGCGEGGNIFNFVMGLEGLNFIETVEYLANKADIDLPTRDSSQDKRRRNKKQQIFAVHKLATKFYHYLLLESEVGNQGHQYFLDRGFNEETIKKFRLGFAPDRWEQLYKFLSRKDYSKEILAKSGLVIPRKNSSGYYDRFRNRIIFTIFDHRGQPIGFGGRVLSSDDKPKYLNSPETPIFDKSHHLYGLNLAKRTIRKKEEAIIFEGYTDVITAYQAGIKNVVASLGTSLTKEQAKLLHRYAEKVYIAYDADTAGAKATLRGLDILKKEGLVVEVIQLPIGQDPDEVINENGPSKFKELIEQAVPLIEFKINSILPEKRFKDIDDKVAAFKNVLPVLNQIEIEIERDEYLGFVAEKLGIKEKNIGVLKRELNKYRKYKVQGNKDIKSKNRYNNTNDLKKELDKSQTSGYDSAIKGLIQIIINHHEFIPKLKQRLKPDEFIDDKYRQIIALIYRFYEANTDFKVDDLLEEINDQEIKKLLLRLSIQDVVSGDLDKMFFDHISKVKEHQFRMKIDNLDQRIKQAERENEFSKLDQLLQEYQKYQGLLRKEGN